MTTTMLISNVKRSGTGRPRCDRVADARHDGTATRVRTRQADPRGVGRPPRPESKRALSRALSPGAATLDRVSLGHLRQQPEGQVLRADGTRTSTDSRWRGM